MAYVCEFRNGQTVYLDNQGTRTIVTTVNQTPGQQQQSSNGFQTGNWTATPQIHPIASGVIIKLTTDQGEHYLQVQGSSMGMIQSSPDLEQSPQLPLEEVDHLPTANLPSMQPMKPMQPMKMGNMEMNMNPMEMKMGNMEMKMGSHPTSSGKRQFCSQCGSAIKPDDRFCSSCGHQLN